MPLCLHFHMDDFFHPFESRLDSRRRFCDNARLCVRLESTVNGERTEKFDIGRRRSELHKETDLFTPAIAMTTNRNSAKTLPSLFVYCRKENFWNWLFVDLRHRN